jgi:hypothetical protein
MLQIYNCARIPPLKLYAYRYIYVCVCVYTYAYIYICIKRRKDERKNIGNYPPSKIMSLLSKSRGHLFIDQDSKKNERKRKKRSDKKEEE